MGCATSAINISPNAIYWNPAGLAFIPNKISFATTITSNSSKWQELDDIDSHQFFALAYSQPNIGTFSFGYIGYGINNIECRTGETDQSIIGYFDDKESALLFAYARELLKDEFALGFGIKYVSQEFTLSGDDYDGASASGLGFSLGLRYSPVEYVSASIYTEPGFKLKWESGNEDIILKKGKIGFAFFPMEGLTLAFDLVQMQTRPLKLNLGTEYTYYPSQYIISDGNGISSLSLRLGLEGHYIENRYKDVEENKNTNFTFGLGLGVTMNKRDILSIDYAYGSYRLGNKNRIGLILSY